MDKKGERGKRSSPQSTSRRAYDLFTNIINLSSGARSGSPQNSLADSPSTNSKPLDASTKKKKKSGHQSPSSCSSISSSGGGGAVGGGMNPPLPIGTGPRTFSILTALNELAVSDQEYHHDIRRRKSLTPSSIAKSSQRHPLPSSSISSGNSTSTSSSTGTFQHSLRQAIKPGGKLGRLGTNRKGTPTSPSQKTRESEKLSNSNERRKSKETTPEWIWKIFQLAKHGRLHELQQSLKGLDPTLIRHLADTKGSTLLHCAARGGHLSTLQWLVSILGPHTEAALNDHNRAGLTVILTALKGGRLECFQWLVLNTNSGDTALVPNDGERSLLHYAASYGDEIAVRWLSQVLHERGIHVDVRDASGLTPLHMSAKSGYILVCHELIFAGADPISKTELGWRPVDLAVRQRRMECVNYLLMAETAASLGTDLHLLLKEFQVLRQEHDSLRSHFRELLRVGKWLVKERTNLIKNFPSIGSKSQSEASILLGGTSNGTRFSELEHKLVQAEQAWKCLSVVNHISEPRELPENCSSYHFQKSLADAQSRCDKNLSLSAPSSSDEESCLSAASTSDDGDNVCDHPIYPQRKSSSQQQYYYHQNHQPYSHHPFSKKDRPKTSTTTAPWLLPPNDGLLAQLSPFVSQLDLLGNAPSAPAQIPSTSNQPAHSSDEMAPESPNPVDSVGDQSLVTSNRAFLGVSQQAKNTSNVEATVLEVIEPTSSPIKGAYFTPDLIREHKCGRTVESVGSEWLGAEGERRLDETIYSEIKGSSYSSSTSIKSYTPIVEHPPPVFQQKQKKHSFPLPTKCQKQRVSCTTSVYSSHGHSIRPTSISPLDIQFLGHENTSEDNFSKTDSCETQLLNLESNESLLLTNTPGPSSSMIASNTSRLTVLPVSIESTPKLSFPILPLDKLSHGQLESVGSQEEISCGPSGLGPPDSVSTSNTPVMKRSYSSVSRTSSTVLFPFRKGSWVCPEFSSSMTTESGLTGRLSPSPSEASRTESALAPPPSNASHASQNSEASKTESARGISANADEREPEYGEDSKAHHQSNYECPVQEVTEDEGKSETASKGSSQNNSGERKRNDGRKDDEDDESKNITSLGSMPPQNIQAIPCIMRPLVSSGIHKATIQRVTKSGRGQSKPWYEFEGSDDEGTLLQKASRSRSSRSSKLSTSSLSNSESQNESETSGDEHECDQECDTTSCPRHNCTDFV